MSPQTKDRSGLSWTKICEDPLLQDLPYKVETNQYGQIVLSPHSRLHSRLQILVNDRLRDHLDHGERFVELAIETANGTKVADVAWMSADRYVSIPESAEPTPQAPEICVEIRSAGNSDHEMAEKRSLYFDAGAEEVWICAEDGTLTFHDQTGEIDASHRVPAFPRQLER